MTIESCDGDDLNLLSHRFAWCHVVRSGNSQHCVRCKTSDVNDHLADCDCDCDSAGRGHNAASHMVQNTVSTDQNFSDTPTNKNLGP